MTRLKHKSYIKIQKNNYIVTGKNLTLKDNEHGEPRIQLTGNSESYSIEKAVQIGLLSTQELPSHVNPENNQSKTSNISKTNSVVTGSDSLSNVYYLQACDLRVQSYIGKGLILPSFYDSSKNISGDIISEFPYQLVLYKTSPPAQDKQLILSIRLSPEEIEKYSTGAESDTIFVPVPLPVSRITAIETPPESDDSEQYARGWINSDLPVPKHLFSTVPKNWEKRKPMDVSSDSVVHPDEKIFDCISCFNRSLGLMAFIRNAEFYFGQQTGSYTELPKDFVLLRQSLIKGAYEGEVTWPILLKLLDIKIFCKEKLREIYLSPGETALVELLESKKSDFMDKEAVKNIVKKFIEEHYYNENIRKAFNDLFRNPDNYRGTVKTLREIQVADAVRITAVIYKFSQRNARGDRLIKEKLAEDWRSPEQTIPILGAMGAYYGYQKLDATEFPRSPKKFLPEKPDIKFHLRNEWERELIEAVYQHTFRKHANRNFQTENRPTPPQGSEKQNKTSNKSITVTERTDYNIARKDDTSTLFRQCISMLEKTFSNEIDEKSETGKYLLPICWPETGKQQIHKGKSALLYSISLKDLITLLKKHQDEINLPVLLSAIKEDEDGQRKKTNGY